MFYIDHVKQRTTKERPNLPPRKGSVLTNEDMMKRKRSRKYIEEATVAALTHAGTYQTDDNARAKPARPTRSDASASEAASDVESVRSAPRSVIGSERTWDAIEVADGASQVTSAHPPRTLEVKVLRPEEGGFGFTLRGGFPKDVVVHKVLPGFPAYDILHTNDKIITINGVSITKLAHADILDILSSSPPCEFAIFTIIRDQHVNGLCSQSFAVHFNAVPVVVPQAALPVTLNSTVNTSVAGPPPGVQSISVIIQKIRGSFGFNLASTAPPHVIASVDPLGHAAKDGIHERDVIVLVAGRDVQPLSQPELFDLLLQVTDAGPVQAVVYRSRLFKMIFRIQSSSLFPSTCPD